ncbi:MAG TPA: tetratricopeptide repeat protein, partial [Pirellulaceae bacterium]
PTYVAWLVIAVSLYFSGCRQQARIATAKSEADQRSAAMSEQNHIRAALDFLKEFDRYQQPTTLGRVLHHLRKWTEDKLPDSDWIADPMFGRLPDRLGISKNPAQLARIDFDPQDVAMLRETMWIRDLAKRIARDPRLDPEWSVWLPTQTELDATAAQDLESFLAVCDWIVRNIQIEPLEIEAPPNVNTEASRPRPGVRRTAWEALLTGRGDAICRGRLIALVCRQLDIPVVALAEDSADEPPPWCVAALIADRLYLYDPAWALPIPGPDGQGIATLEQVVTDPQILRQLDVSDELKYPLGSVELASQVALVDATPQYLSQRMRLLELALPSTDKTILTCAPSALRQRLEGHRGIGRVAIWTQPYDVDRFRATDLANYPQLAEELSRDMSPLQPPWPLSFARGQHIRGIFDDPEYQEGARQLYLKCRLSDAQIDGINTAEDLQQLLDSLLGAGNPVPEDAAIVRQILQATRNILLTTRSAASWGLGQIAFESGEFQVAIDYFDKRLLSFDTDTTWHTGSLYNLGRAYEALGRTAGQADALRRAREYYLRESTSPQGPGNQIRARRLPS